MLHYVFWNHLDITSEASATSQADQKLLTLDRKFQHLTMKARSEGHKSSLQGTSSVHNKKTTTTKNQVDNIPIQPFLNNRTDHNCEPSIIENRSNVILNPKQSEALEFGLNFSLPPRQENLEELICQLENKISTYEPQVSNELRTIIAKDIRNNLQLMTTKRYNPTQSIKSLTKEDIYVIKADKGNKTVIVNQKDYELGVNNLLCDEDNYTKVNSNPITTIVSKVKQAINSCTSIDDYSKAYLLPSVHTLPKLYAVPKIHKPNMPFRPIIANSGSVTHPLAKYVNNKLTFLNHFCTHTVNNSSDLVKILKHTPLTKEDILVSFDVKNLFTNIPPSEAIATMEELLMANYNKHLNLIECYDLIKLSKVCLDLTFFEHRNTFYKQTNGLAMGSPLSPLLANVFMDKIESHILNRTKFKPKLWLRYVDDIFCIWPNNKSELNNFLLFINSVHPKIQFTIEIEQNHTLPFLDVNIKRNQDLTFNTSVYRKPGTVCCSPHSWSCHPWIQKISGFYTLVLRAYTLSSNNIELNRELDILRLQIKSRGYNNHIIDRLSQKINNKLNITNNTTLSSLRKKHTTVTIPYIPRLSNTISKTLRKYNIHATFKPQNKISSITNRFKNKTPSNMLSGIYRIDCNNCEDRYIGQTSRSFKYRLAEHRRASGTIRNKFYPNQIKPEKSAVAKHVLEKKHSINWDQAKIIKQCPKQLLNQFESLHIYKNRINIMNRKEDNNFPRVWQSIIDNLQSTNPTTSVT